MMPSAPVWARAAVTSSNVWMPPFASTGMVRVSFTRLMRSQSASLMAGPFISFVRPWTVSMLQPFCWNMLASCEVRVSVRVS